MSTKIAALPVAAGMAACLHAAMRVRAVCFDYGGTLDAPGIHWLERFAALYAEAGLELSWEQVRDAFDYATGRAYRDPAVPAYSLEPLIRFHVREQLHRLAIDDRRIARQLEGGFIVAARASLDESRLVLQRLRERFDLGVISNFYGNVDRLLAEAGILPLLRVVIDSNRVGVSKPDAAIFRLAVDGFGCAPDEIVYVGDSFPKDVVGARGAGLRAAWLVGMLERECPEPSLVDLQIRSLAELEQHLDTL